jgi:hypothetical protein
MGWNDATQCTYQVNGNSADLGKNYGLIPMNEIAAQSKPWYEHTGAKKEECAAQNNAQMFEMMMNSLSPLLRKNK